MPLHPHSHPPPAPAKKRPKTRGAVGPPAVPNAGATAPNIRKPKELHGQAGQRQP